MKKKPVRILKLNRETLINLDEHRHLEMVNGGHASGGNGPTCECDPT